MEDIAPGLLEKIQRTFREMYESDEEIKELLEKLQGHMAKHPEAYTYAGKVGNILADAYSKNLSSSVLPEGKMWYNIGNRIIPPTLSELYEDISDYVTQVQAQLNSAAGIGIKPIVPPENKDRGKGIVDRLSSESNFDDVSWILGETISTIGKSIVDDSIEANAEFHGKAGMHPKITRSSSGKCCEWCNKVAGIYSYPDVPKDVYRRHQNCDCTVEYDPGNGKKRNVHTKQWKNEDEYGKIKKRKKIGLVNKERKISTDGKRNELSLTEYQIQEAKRIAKEQGYDGEIIYSDFQNTSFHGSIEGDVFHYLVIGTDAYPVEGRSDGSANELISIGGCMAHEIVGHYEAWCRGTTQSIEVLEEAQASIRASKFGIGLTDKERELLYKDAVTRLENANIDINDVIEKLDVWER